MKTMIAILATIPALLCADLYQDKFAECYYEGDAKLILTCTKTYVEWNGHLYEIEVLGHSDECECNPDYVLDGD